VSNRPESSLDTIEIPLKDAGWAALIGWLVPGAGHFYQRRFTKGVIFSACILSTFFYGLWLGNGQVVYASWRPNDYRWQYFCQLGVGLPAMPAILQNLKSRNGGAPFLANRAFMVAENGEVLAEVDLGTEGAVETGFYSPPPGPIPTDELCVLALWNDELQHGFEIGTLFTVVAGLLNLLAVYDAFAGPAMSKEEDETSNSADDESDS
jgi:hypothetical protein